MDNSDFVTLGPKRWSVIEFCEPVATDELELIVAASSRWTPFRVNHDAKGNVALYALCESEHIRDQAQSIAQQSLIDIRLRKKIDNAFGIEIEALINAYLVRTYAPK